MRLTKKNLFNIPDNPALVKPEPGSFELPEKVLQFGTGILLRGLPDLIINNANNAGLFNGRIVIVKSTATGGMDEFSTQDGLYTVCIRGIDEGKKTEENHIVSAVSRVLSAASEWDAVLECADNPDMQVIISNTTEVGIALMQDNIHQAPPLSFPGKLVAFLYQRFKHFKGDPGKGMVIVPTELIPDNGEILLSIVLELAHQNNLETSFIDWIENANYFCNSLVDRIVPGKLQPYEQKKIEISLGYTDQLMIVSEVYALWAIESSSEVVKERLSFADHDNGVVIAPDINKFRELKLRLLNGSHTFSCGLAHLAGFNTVKEAMDNRDFSEYIYKLMHHEIVPELTKRKVSADKANIFADKVLDRYRNAFIEHKWLSITMQYSSKMLLRNVDIIASAFSSNGYLPAHISLGIAAHILFMKGVKEADGNYYGTANGHQYLITDNNAALYAEAWQQDDVELAVEKIVCNVQLWQSGTTAMSGSSKVILSWLKILMTEGATAALKMVDKQKTEIVHEK